MARELAVLVVKVTADTAEVKASFERLGKDAEPVSKAFDSIGTRAVAVGNMISGAFSKALSLAGSAIGGLWNEVQRGIKLSAEYNGAIIGLIGVTRAYGGSAEQAMTAAKSLASDGLLTVGDAAKSLKNLLQTGFGLKEATDIVNTFKDAAVYGRQANFAYNDSIVTATEGIKNMLSRNVDNVGITKNLSVIMAEAGMKMSDLTDKIKGAAARTALYNGLMREAAAASGDAARSLGTYHGAMASLDTSYKSLLAHVGDYVTLNKDVGIALQFVGEMMRSLTGYLNSNKQGYLLVADAIIFVVRGLSQLLTVIDYVYLGFTSAKIVVNTFLESLYATAGAIFRFQEKAAGIAMYLDPANYQRHAAAVREAKDAYTWLDGAVEGFQLASRDATQQSIDFGNKIAVVKVELDRLEEKLVANRGQVADLGDMARPAGQKIDQFAGAVDKTSKAAAKAAEEIRKMKEEMLESFWKVEAAMKKVMDAWDKTIEATRKELFGETAVEEARDYAFAIGDIKNVARLSAASLERVNTSVYEGIQAFRRGAQATESEVAAMTALYYATLPVPEVINGVGNSLTNLGKVVDIDFKKMIDGMTDHLHPIKDVFRSIFADLPQMLGDAFTSSEGFLVSIATSVGQKFSAAFKNAVKDAKAEGRDLTGGEKALGIAGMGLDAFIGGYGMGTSLGKAKGALAGGATGALSGAAVGTAIAPGIGTAIGAVVGGAAGLFGGLFGGAKKAKEERAELEKNKKALLEQYGGMQKLTQLAEKLGVNISKAFDAKKPAQFQAAVDELNKAIEEQNKRLEGLKTALDGVNKRAENFGKQFTKAFEDKDTAKLAEIAQRTQPEFERLGLMIRDTFAGLVKETGNGIDALTQMAPAFEVLKHGVEDWGLTSTAVIDELLKNFNLVNDEALKPLFENIAASGQVLRGLFDASALSPEGFQAIAADIGQSIQEIVNKGGDMQRTLALSTPVLQTLWEAQQRYGAVTDDTTAAILRQAQEQGLVGDHMKDTNKQILDVLLAIGKVLGADLPTYFNKLKAPADAAATEISDAFDLHIDPIEIPYVYVAMNDAPDGIPQLGQGGVVRTPTLAIVGERGPEAVVPLTGDGLGVSGSGTYQTDIYLDGERIARSTAKKMPRILRAMGV